MENIENNKFVIELIGYLAAITTNISLYPQAYEVYIIIDTKEYDKLNSISIPTFSLQILGCIFWLTYALLLKIQPIIAGSIMSMLPSSYITYKTYIYRNHNTSTVRDHENIIQNEINNINKDDGEIIIASGSNYQEYNN